MHLSKRKICSCMLAFVLAFSFMATQSISSIYAAGNNEQNPVLAEEKNENDNVTTEEQKTNVPTPVAGQRAKAPAPVDNQKELTSLIFQVFVHKSDFQNKKSAFTTISSKSDIDGVIPGYSLENLKFGISVNGGEEKIVSAKYAGITNNSGWITLGDYHVGDKLNIRLITETLPDGFHLMTSNYNGEEFEKPTFSLTVVKLDPAKNAKGILTLAQQVVAFDPAGNLFKDGTSNVKEVWVTKDSTLNIPEGPVKDGYIFKGWFCKRIGQEKGRILQPGIKVGAVQADYFIAYEPASSDQTHRGYGYTIAKPIFVKAMNVNFYDIDKQLIKTQVVEKNKKAESIDAPMVKDSKFLYWADAAGTQFNFDSTITEDTNLYAKYTGLPVLTVRDMTVSKGDKNFNLLDLVVSATDKEDGDISNKVDIVNDGHFDINTPGKYDIKFFVSDKDGNEVTATATVTVTDKSATDTTNPNNNQNNRNNNSNRKTPKTGDASNLINFIAFATAGMGLFLTRKYKSNTINNK